MRNLGFEIDIENILFGNASFENDKNSELFSNNEGPCRCP
jgi:hypothetical protein